MILALRDGQRFDRVDLPDTMKPLDVSKENKNIQQHTRRLLLHALNIKSTLNVN